jgi:hypothetical protein
VGARVRGGFLSVDQRSRQPRLWGTFHLADARAPAVPNSVPAVLGNVGVKDAVEIFWLRIQSPFAAFEVWTARATPDPNLNWRWTSPYRIDDFAR